MLFHSLSDVRTIVCRRHDRALLLCVLGLGLVYQLLLLLILVLRMLSSLCRGDCALVGEAVEDAKGEGGPPEDLEVDQSDLSRPKTANCTLVSQDARRRGTAAVGHCEVKTADVR